VVVQACRPSLFSWRSCREQGVLGTAPGIVLVAVAVIDRVFFDIGIKSAKVAEGGAQIAKTGRCAPGTRVRPAVVARHFPDIVALEWAVV